MATADIGIRVLLEDAALAGLSAISGALGNMGNAASRANRAMGDLGNGSAIMNGVLMGGVASLALFGGALVYSIKAAADFQTQMFGVAVATHVPMATAMQYAGTLMNLAATSTYSSDQIASGIALLGRSGYSISQIFDVAKGATESMATAAIALGMATRSTATQAFGMLAQVMAAYSMKAAQAAQASDILQFGFEHQRGSVTEFASGLSQVTGMAGQLHIPLTDIVSALDVLGPAMRSTSAGGTALRYTLAGLYSPTAAGQKEMVALGLASVDASGKFHSAFYNANGSAKTLDTSLHILAQRLSTMTDQQRIEALHNLFSIKGGQGADALLQNLSKLDSYLKTLKDTSDNAGGAMRRWQEVMNTAQGAQAGFTSSLRDLGIVVGSAVLPVITNLLNGANRLISGIRTWAMANQSVLPTFLMLGAAISAVVILVAFFMTGIGEVVGIILLVVAGVSLLAAGIMFLVNWFKQAYASATPLGSALRNLVAFVKEVAGVVAGAFADAWKIILPQLKSIWQSLQQLGAALQPLLPILGMVAVVLLGIFLGALVGVIKGLAGFLAGLSVFISGVVMIFTGLVQIIAGAFHIIVGIIFGSGDQVKQGLSLIGQGVMNILGGAFKAVVGVIMAAVGVIVGFVGGFVQTIISFFTHLANVLVGHSIVPDMMNAIVNVIRSGLSNIIAFIASGIAQIISHFMQMGSQVISVVTSTWSRFQSYVGSTMSTIGGIINAAAGLIEAIITRLGSTVVVEAINAFNNFRNAAQNGMAAAANIVNSAASNIIGIVSRLAGSMFSWGANAMGQFAAGLGSMLGNVVSQVESAASSVANFLAHASPAKMGPLSHDDKWMPNMMQMFADGIRQGAPLLQSALVDATGGLAAVPSMTGVPLMSRMSSPTNVSPWGNGLGGNQTINLVVDGKVLTQVVMNSVTGQMQMNGLGRAFR